MSEQTTALPPVQSDGEIFTRKGFVAGISMFDGSAEYAASYGVHLRIELKEPAGKGFRTELRKAATKDVVAKIHHIPASAYPLYCEIDMVEKASKRATELVVVAIRPLQAGGKKAA